MTEEQRNESRTTTRFKWISIATAAALLAGLIAAATSGVASAQTVIDRVEPEVVERVERSRVFQDDEGSEVDGQGEFEEISPADEAVFDRYDECLVDAGIDLDAAFELDDADIDDGVWDAAFERCDPILDELSGDFADVFSGEFDSFTPADEALFDEYDQCLEDGGIDTLFEGEAIDEAAVDALFNECGQVLDGLSIEAQAFFEDCPEDDDHEDAGEREGAGG